MKMKKLERPIDTAAAVIAPRPSGSGIAGTSLFKDGTANFAAVTSGDILAVVEGTNINHWIITGIPDSITVDVETNILGTMNGYTGQYGIFPSSGGNITDGATLQAIYSFLKEEWKTPATTARFT